MTFFKIHLKQNYSNNSFLNKSYKLYYYKQLKTVFKAYFYNAQIEKNVKCFSLKLITGFQQKQTVLANYYFYEDIVFNNMYVV